MRNSLTAGCNCGKKAGSMSYQFTAPSGAKTTYRTEIEARAAQIRHGGGDIKTISK